MRRAKTPFARCPCTKTAICAGAVNHLNHTNCVNHSSDKCQPALVHALLPVNPSIRRKRASSSAHTRPARPRARPSPATRLPSCAQNFFTQSLVNSRELSSISRTRAHTCAPPPSAAEGPPARPVPGPRRARSSPASRLPCCAQNFLPNLTHSLAISRVTLLHLSFLSTPSTALKVLLTSILLETGTLPANQTTVSWPSRLPLPNTKYAIRRPTCSFPLARACTTV